MGKRLIGITTILLFLLAVVPMFAQESTVRGSLAGTVVDSLGAVIVGAKVTAVGATDTRTMETDGQGNFSFGALHPGPFTVTATKDGFKTVTVKDAVVNTGITTSVRLGMQPGAVGETVEVTANAVMVDTAATNIGSSLDDSFYSRVPIGRNVTSIFYASPGVSGGGGTGAANPSISGGSGLENQYVADGVNITDGAFGGIGVFSPIYGALSTGINLSFVKEVQVKTGGFEPQYGKSTGGLVQIVTKSGGDAYHGGITAFFGPQQFEAQRLNADNFNRLNEAGLLVHDGGDDVSGEIGGYVPGLKDRLFFFGSFNPSWTTQFSQLADLHGVFSYPLSGKPVALKQTAYDYAAKLTFRLANNHQLESSVFGDPTRSNSSAFNNTETFSDTTFSKLSNGSRNWVVRYNGTLSPTWLVNASFAWGHNYLTETPNNSVLNQIADSTGCGYTGNNGSSSCITQLTPGTLNGPLGPLSGTYVRQGLGFTENTEGDNYSLNFGTQKIVNVLGTHTLSLGYNYEKSFYKGTRDYSGQLFTITPSMAADMGLPTTAGLQSSAAFSLRITSNPIYPTMFVPGVGLKHVRLLQQRGVFDNTPFNTDGSYHAVYAGDSWAINRHVTVNIGWRWEQQRMQGTPYTDFRTGQAFHTHYVYNDNWSPRLGLAIDPMGDKRTKIYGNFARTSYAIPLDMAIRSLSNELDFPTSYWAPVSDASGNVVINSDGTLANPILDDAHYHSIGAGASLSSTENIAPGTKMQYLQEWVVGAEHEFPGGIVVDVRWMDRRLKRIVEDVAGISPEAFQIGLNQNYTITNPTAKTDLYINPIQVDYPVGGLPASCTGLELGGTATDFAGNPVGDFCITNAYSGFNPDGSPIQLAGALGHDGKPDGFVNPVRIYKSITLEVNKAFSNGWQMRTNYRWAELLGNYEGAFRNDNGQADPSISSLFDFIQGDFGLLGDQFAVGALNTDRRHIVNMFLSYSFSHGFAKNLTLGTGVRVETGTPISDLRAHPAYQNSGEIPVGGRGALGRTSTDGQADIHADYKFRLNEKHSIVLGADLFNLTNQRTQLRVDQNQDRSLGVANADFLKPTQGTGLNPQLGFQAPFHARLMVQWVF